MNAGVRPGPGELASALPGDTSDTGDSPGEARLAIENTRGILRAAFARGSLDIARVAWTGMERVARSRARASPDLA